MALGAVFQHPVSKRRERGQAQTTLEHSEWNLAGCQPAKFHLHRIGTNREGREVWASTLAPMLWAQGFRAGLAVGGKYDDIGVGGFGVARNQGCRFLLVCSPMRSPSRINKEAQRRLLQATGLCNLLLT